MSLSTCQPCRHVEIPVFFKSDIFLLDRFIMSAFSAPLQGSCVEKLIDLTKWERNDDNNGH